jgi:NAD(P)H-flavin reductase
MELIISTQSGFTRDLHRYAEKYPGSNLKVSVEGPYGTHPDPMDYDKVILIAGGSGATFTFGLVTDMLKHMADDSKKRVDFIWVVRETGKLNETRTKSLVLTSNCQIN